MENDFWRQFLRVHHNVYAFLWRNFKQTLYLLFFTAVLYNNKTGTTTFLCKRLKRECKSKNLNLKLLSLISWCWPAWICIKTPLKFKIEFRVFFLSVLIGSCVDRKTVFSRSQTLKSCSLLEIGDILHFYFLSVSFSVYYPWFIALRFIKFALFITFCREHSPSEDEEHPEELEHISDLTHFEIYGSTPPRTRIKVKNKSWDRKQKM